MKAHVFIRSYSRDFPWLSYALRSIAKYCTGFTGVTVAVPEHDREEAQDFPWLQPNWNSYGVQFVFAPEGPKGMLEGQLKLCRCDLIVPPDITHVLLTDSDCIFTNPTKPEDYTINGKPIMIGARFDEMTPDMGQLKWRDAAFNALGFVPEYEFMSRHPTFYPTWIFPLFRDAVAKHTGMKFDDYVLSCRNEFPQTFAELTTIGAFVNKHYSECFETLILESEAFKLRDKREVDYISPHDRLADSGNPAMMDHLKAFWSHAGISAYRDELDAIVK